VRAAIPPTRRRVELFAIGRDAGAIDPGFVLALPEDFIALNIEGAEPAARARVIDGVIARVAAEPAQPFLARNLDPTDEAMPVVDVEHEDALARAAARLSAIGRAQVEITSKSGFCRVSLQE